MKARLRRGLAAAVHKMLTKHGLTKTDLRRDMDAGLLASLCPGTTVRLAWNLFYA
jgi:hypothetical protein